MDILNLVDRLEGLATSAGRLPRTRKALMDLDRLLELVDQMRLAIPKDIQDAESILTRREAVVNQALMDARRIKASAEEESRNRVDTSEITQGARRQAEEMLADAKQRADALLQDAQRKAHQAMQDAQSFGDTRVGEANRYAHETLAELEQHLSVVLSSVRRGLDSLEQMQAVKVG